MQRIIVDTSVLWDMDALARLEPLGRKAILPAVAFTERARQLHRVGRPVGELWDIVAWAGLEVEPFMPQHGLRIAARLDDLAWRRHARDAFIAGHAEDEDVLWTKTPRDFLAMGLRKEQVLAV
ncbi:MAG: hypothetical protein ABR562_04720 [Thermoplasmatota archaeon]|nr:hypothetical protein [Halobacteriales archaeon]